MTPLSTTRAVERCERLHGLGPPPAWWRVFALRRWFAAYRAIMALDISAAAEMLRQLCPVGLMEQLTNRARPALQSMLKAAAPPRGPHRRNRPASGTVEYEEP